MDGKASTSHNHDTVYSKLESVYSQLLNAAIPTSWTSKTLSASINNYKFLTFVMDTGDGGNTLSAVYTIPRKMFTDKQHVVLNYSASPAINAEVKYSSLTTVVIKCSDQYRTLQIYGSN